MNNQEKIFLDDRKKNGESIEWKEKKQGALMVADAFERLAVKYASRKTGDKEKMINHSHYEKRFKSVFGCGTYLEYKVHKVTAEKKLNHANFCKVRLCPMCAWRRSLKIFGQVSRVMEVANSNKSNRFLFVTLTQRNVKGEELKAEITKIFKAYNDFIRRDDIKKMNLGWFRALEVTYNFKDKTFHPHLHVVFMVKSFYFRNKNLYLDQSQIQQLWQEALKVDYAPSVYIEAVKRKKGKGIAGVVAEVAKYTVKESDLIIKDKETGEYFLDESDENIKILDDALAHRRLTAFGGELKDIHKKLKLDDADAGDLVNTDNSEELGEDLEYIIEKYSWNIGFSNYVKVG